MRQDLSYAARGLARAPVFTLATTVTLAVGVGATSAVYLLMQRTVMAELPVSDPERLVRIDSDRGADGINQNLSYPLFAMIRNQARSFEGVVVIV